MPTYTDSNTTVPLVVTDTYSVTVPEAMRDANPEPRTYSKEEYDILHSVGVRKEFTARQEGDKLIVEGYAIVWNSPTLLYTIDDKDIYEQVAPGTWGLAARAETVLLQAHNWQGSVFASAKSGTMKIKSDAVGLRVVAELDARQQVAKDMWASVERGDVWGQSVGFSVGKGFKEKREVMEDGNVLYTITKSPRLFETSLLWNPAYKDTSISARQVLLRTEMRASADDGIETREDDAVDTRADKPDVSTSERRSRRIARNRRKLAALSPRGEE